MTGATATLAQHSLVKIINILISLRCLDHHVYQTRPIDQALRLSTIQGDGSIQERYPNPLLGRLLLSRYS
jgi:hypothetical protein